MNLASMYCPDLSTSNYSLQGDTLSNGYKIFRFQIGLCSGNGCADNATINAILSTLQILPLYANSYYDHTDLNSPIKSYFSTTSFL